MTGVAPATAGRYRKTRLVTGPPGSGPGSLQQAFIEEVRRLKSADPLRPVRVLVGTNYLRLHLGRLLAVRLGGHVNITFMLLGDLAAELGTPALVDRGRRRLPERARDLLLREVASARSHGTYFRAIAGTEGFIEALGATLRDLKEAAIDPSALRAAGAGLRAAAASRDRSSGGARQTAEKLEDLADLYEAYDEMLRDLRFYDDEDLIRSAAQHAAGDGRIPPHVLVYGFYDATWTQKLLIQETLAFRAGTVFFPWDGSATDGSWEYARPMLDWLSGWIPERGETARRGSPRDHETELLSAPGEARETLEAVRWLVARSRERSVPFGEMALLYRAPEPYARLAHEVMSVAGGVPHFLANGLALSSTPAARALTLLLAARENALSRRTVIEFLSLAAGEGPTALWDRLSAEAGVVRGIDQWRERIDRLAARLARDPARTPDIRPLRDLARRVEELNEGLALLPAVATWRAHADVVVSVLGRFVPGGPSREAVSSCVETLGALDAVSTPVSRPDFAAALRRALDHATTRGEAERHFQRSGIFVGDVMESRLLPFHAVAVMGLVEKSFPAPARQDPILLDEERDLVNKVAGGPRLALKTRRLEEERLLYRLAGASAAESLLLSYPRLDPATGRPRLPSPFLLRTAETLEGSLIDYERLERLPRMRRVALSSLAPRDAAAALLPREFDMRALLAALQEPGQRQRLASLLHTNPILHRALQAEQARWGEPRFTAHDGVILRPNVLESLRAAHQVRDVAVSASRIESYAACPLAYFMRQVLQLAALDEPEEAERIDPLGRGTLVHRILFELFSALKGRGLLPLTPERRPAALAVLDEVCRRCFAEHAATGVTGYPMLWEIDQEQIRDDLAEVIAAETADSSWIPAHFEIRYGMPARPGQGDDPSSSDAPIPFEASPGRTVPLKGCIDRVDISADGGSARVTDYKTGRMAGYRKGSLQGGRSVQLPLYMHAVEKLLGARRPGLRSGEARYLSVDRKGEFRSVVFDAEALASRREDIARIVTTFISGVGRGVFFAFPEPSVCRFCDYKLACGEGREARFARKRGDATAADYLRMREGIE